MNVSVVAVTNRPMRDIQSRDFCHGQYP
jgi:hypothetical protein